MSAHAQLTYTIGRISTLSGILVKHEVVNIENMYVFEL